MPHSSISDTVGSFIRSRGYRKYLWQKYMGFLGYQSEQWVRMIYSQEWRDFFSALPLHTLRVLEISPGSRPLIDKDRVKYYCAVHFPEFDISRDVLSVKFDLIIAEQVFEHLRHPYKAALNVHRMLSDSGVFLIATPFLIKIHQVPCDYTRWTPDGLAAFLEDCGFKSEVHSWGNRKAVKANFKQWSDYGWRRNLSNETDFPICVWAYARKQAPVGNAE